MAVVVMLFLMDQTYEMGCVFQDIADFLLWGGSAFLHHFKIIHQWFQSMYDRQKPHFLCFSLFNEQYLNRRF